MSKNLDKDVFKQGSTTYYLSSKFFPKAFRRDLFRLYSFLRTIDNYVDETPVQTKKLQEIDTAYKKAVKDAAFDPTTHAWDDVDSRIVKNMVRLTQRYSFEPDWIEAFINSMKQDIKPIAFKKLDDSLQYVYGSAEVVGLMMARLMKLPEETWEAARLQGRAMQWINFVRDIGEDISKGRQYFPEDDLQAAGLSELSETAARENPKAFKKFIDIQLKRYRDWQNQAAKQYDNIPKLYRIPLQTAADMYGWTARKIEKNPMIVFRKSLKPRKARVVSRGLRRAAVQQTNDLKQRLKKLRR